MQSDDQSCWLAKAYVLPWTVTTGPYTHQSPAAMQTVTMLAAKVSVYAASALLMLNSLFE